MNNMLSPSDFYNALKKNNIDFFAGVPDSLLKDFCAYIIDNVPLEKNIIAANEGGAVALAAGYYLATKKLGLVYMQNSGQGNSINPLTSLVDSDVYNIPVLLLIGWRGEPGVKDEPQHIKQGKITIPLLETLGIPWQILPDSIEKAEISINEAISYINEKNSPYALIVKKGIFEKYELKNKIKTSYGLRREDVLKILVDNLDSNAVIVSTTGKTSRELFEYREFLRQGHEKDFLTVGSMGHSSQIALGIALSKPDKQIYCFDGDGAFIMHMGSLAIIGQRSPKNFKHIIFNNGSHESVGGQPTAGFDIDIPGIAKACGYKFALTAESSQEIVSGIKLLKERDGPCLLEIKINKGSRENLGRPTTTPAKNKKSFMDFLAR